MRPPRRPCYNRGTIMLNYRFSLPVVALLLSTPANADFNDAVVLYLQGNYEESLGMMKGLANTADEPLAMYYVGVMLDKGQGTDKDEEEAAKWLQLASENGIPAAQFKLANKYYSGSGLPKDYERAYAWFSTAAEHGHGPSRLAIEKAAKKLNQEELEAAGQLSLEYLQRYGPEAFPAREDPGKKAGQPDKPGQ